MGLLDTVQLREDIPSTFENDGYKLNADLYRKYKMSRIKIGKDQTDEGECLYKGADIFDVRGLRVAHGNVTDSNIDHMLGVYYILPEYTLPSTQNHENILFVKRKAVAEIVDGKIQTS